MIPILASSYPFTGNGLGGLSDALECIVEHEVNGIYELRMRYPITGLHYDELANGCIIMAKPDVLTQTQPFRIYRITKPLNGVVTVYAQHISYDMAGIIVAPFSSASLTSALIDLPNYCTPSSPFNITSTKTVATAFNLHEPKQLWRVLGGSQGSFLDLYGGEWDFDRLDATLKTRLGADRGVQVRYAKNMTQLEQDATLESTYSGVYPYWYDEDTNTLVKLPEDFVTVTGAVVSDRLLLLDCSGDFENQPSAQDLRDRANNYIAANSVGAAKVSWKVNFVQLAQSKEFADQAVLEQVMLGDTVGVFYEALGVNASARIVKTEYDALKEAYQSVTVGRVKQNLASIIVGQNEVMDDKIDAAKSSLERAVDRATDFITNGAGYMRLIYNSSDELVEIVSLDNPDIAQAQNVWRWNNGGFGFSSTGYNGTYGLALTQAGEIVADYITAGTLNANVIRAGLLADSLGNNSWDLATGALTITNGTVNITTAADTTSAIALTHGDYESSMQPVGFFCRDRDNGIQYDVFRYGFYCYKDVGMNSYPLSYLSQSSLYLGSANAAVSSAGYITMYDASQTTRIYLDGANGYLYLKNSSGTNMATLSPGSLSLGGSGTSGSINLTDTGAVKTANISATGSYFYNGTNKYTYLMWPDANGEGRIVLGDGTSTKWRTALENTGLTFRNASDTVTAVYPSNPSTLLSANNLHLSDMTGAITEDIASAGTKTYTLTSGIWLVATAKYNGSTTAHSGLWLVSARSGGTSNILTIVNPSGGTSVSINALTLSVTTGTTYVWVNAFCIS